ncbi:tyrosine-type recombinase/integrase [Actinopolymorpha pittospori]|uniref:Integrase n=1 Tax=Actinopolymorpha pittospori TaxID=648752 RepID=A0A927MUL7_9ACTN|nr:site-specific integrase [Actinopolymorpha pittospori]MBE1605543.1 integrase [Actinopolymorpha pittospori]
MAAKGASMRRMRGFVRKRGNSFQVLVYAGPDPLTGKDTYISESTRDRRQVEKVRTRLLAKVDQQRTGSTKVTLGYTIDAWLQVHEADERTLEGYRGYAERTIKPALGEVPIAKVSARVLEQFYAQLRRCRTRCNGKAYLEHFTDEPHECDQVVHRRVRDHDCAAAKCRVLACNPHQCKPMSASTVRQIHFIISGALSTAVRWEWIPTNPAATTKKPRQPRPQPKPPTPGEAGLIVAAAWEQDEDWGMLVWLVMVTGMRRGELAALRWHDVHLDTGTVEIRRSFTQRAGKAVEKDTKTHQMRRIALDQTTLELLAAHRTRYEDQVAALSGEPSTQAYVFSYEPDHGKPCNPDGVSHRYAAMCADLGIDSHLHALRHYSATELITAGVDIRTVAGRLGHGGGGTTTLRVYTAWVAESDRSAANILAKRISLNRPEA